MIIYFETISLPSERAIHCVRKILDDLLLSMANMSSECAWKVTEIQIDRAYQE